MKKFVPSILTLSFSLLFSLLSTVSFSQISIVSTNGYTVNVNVQPVAIVTNGTTNCQWGYEYKVKLNYTITFSGTNRPSSLYDLQGTIGDGSKAIYFDLPETQGTGTTISSQDYRNQSDCGNATVASFGFNRISIKVKGPGIDERTISYVYVATPLAIKLLSFTATAVNNNIDLKWATATETNNEYFTIERSANATDWSVVKKVKGAGNSVSTLNYETTDESPLAGTSYYRLKQTDFDGTTTYSDVKAVKFSGIAKAVSIFPVPNTGNTITFKGITDYKNNIVTLLNAAGNQVYSANLTKASIELPSVPTGVYFIRVTNKMNGETTNLRYVKI